MPILPHQKSCSSIFMQFLQIAFEVYFWVIEKGLEKHGIEHVKEWICCTKQICKTSVEMSWLQNNQQNGIQLLLMQEWLFLIQSPAESRQSRRKRRSKKGGKFAPIASNKVACRKGQASGWSTKSETKWKKLNLRQEPRGVLGMRRLLKCEQNIIRRSIKMFGMW